jgi:alanine racemase
MSSATLSETPIEQSPSKHLATPPPRRPAWIEVDLGKLENNYRIIAADKPPGVQILSVVKDDAYGHGAPQVAAVALKQGAAFLAFGTLDEALTAREDGIRAPILMLGERFDEELPWCVEHRLTVCVNHEGTVRKLGEIARRLSRRVPVHLKINTGMNRYGVRWTEAPALAELIRATRSLELEGILSHFAMSDEPDKTSALLQLERFTQVDAALAERGLKPRYRHLCNSGGYLDLPAAHFDMVRLGMLQYGVFPSTTCRRLPGVEPVMTVKARIAAVQNLGRDETVGYGLRYRAASPRRIAVVPVGYGDGFPRVRNQGCVLAGGRRAPLIGGVAMDALMVDITDIPTANFGDEVVLMGRQGAEEISVHEIAKWKNSVSYDVLTGWRARLPRIHVGVPLS